MSNNVFSFYGLNNWIAALPLGLGWFIVVGLGGLSRIFLFENRVLTMTFLQRFLLSSFQSFSIWRRLESNTIPLSPLLVKISVQLGVPSAQAGLLATLSRSGLGQLLSFNRRM